MSYFPFLFRCRRVYLVDLFICEIIAPLTCCPLDVSCCEKVTRYLEILGANQHGGGFILSLDKLYDESMKSIDGGFTVSLIRAAESSFHNGDGKEFLAFLSNFILGDGRFDQRLYGFYSSNKCGISLNTDYKPYFKEKDCSSTTSQSSSCAETSSTTSASSYGIKKTRKKFKEHDEKKKGRRVTRKQMEQSLCHKSLFYVYHFRNQIQV